MISTTTLTTRSFVVAFQLASCITLATAATAGDWPQWRGPAGTGISTENDWDSRGRPLWEQQVGRGYSSVSVQAGRLFTLGFDEAKKQDTVFCLDAATGELIWSHSYPAKIWNEAHGGGTLTTPGVDGERLYVTNREGQFFCFEAATGKLRWTHDLRGDLRLKHPHWGFGASPLVLPDMVIVNMGKVLAVDKVTGKPLWTSQRSLGDAYSTPALMNQAGFDALAVFNGDGLVLLERLTGKELARHEWETSYDVNAATPVVIDDRIFVSSGYNRGCAMLQRGDDDELSVLWESKAMRNHMAGCTLSQGHLFGFDDAIFKCLDLEGEERWRLRGIGKGAHSQAGDRLILLSDQGELIVAKAGVDAYEELSRERLFDGGVCWTTPVLVDGRIYCRNSLGHLICRDHRPDAGR